MLLPVVPAGLDPAETEHKGTDPTIAPESQLAIVLSSKDHFATKRRQGKQLPMRPSKSNKLTSTSLSVPKPATNQTQNNSTVENEDEDIHEAVSPDPNYLEQ